MFLRRGIIERLLSDGVLNGRPLDLLRPDTAV
jgi:hypothetical protein